MLQSQQGWNGTRARLSVRVVLVVVLLGGALPMLSGSPGNAAAACQSTFRNGVWHHRGTAGADVCRGRRGAAREVFRTFGGNDLVYGRGGRDAMYLGRGRDGTKGGWGDDWIVGGRGADEIRGGRGDDVLRDTAIGDDRDDLCGDAGADVLNVVDGDTLDRATGGRGPDRWRFDGFGGSQDRVLERRCFAIVP